jgi:hypothetical protein
VGRQSNIQPVDPNTFTAFMEQLQEGYIAAVAATAGCAAEFTKRDVFGIDAQVIRGRASEQDDDVAVNIQLKSTTTVKPDQNKGWF